MHDFLCLWFGLVTADNALNVGEVHLTIVSYETYLGCIGWEAGIVDPPIARDGHEILSIGRYSREWSSSIHIQLLVVTRSNLNCAVKGARKNNSAWEWIKLGADSRCLVDWFIWCLAHCVRNPKVIGSEVCADINATWGRCYGKLVSSHIPRRVQVGTLLLDHTKLWREFRPLLLPDDDTSVRRGAD